MKKNETKFTIRFQPTTKQQVKYADLTNLTRFVKKLDKLTIYSSTSNRYLPLFNAI